MHNNEICNPLFVMNRNTIDNTPKKLLGLKMLLIDNTPDNQ